MLQDMVAIGHMGGLEPRAAAQQFHGHVVRAGDGGRGIGHGLSPSGGAHVLEAGQRAVGAHQHEEGKAR
ncbi:hypothetical protein L0O99_18340, partial [Bilophila wadsworthia]